MIAPPQRPAVTGEEGVTQPPHLVRRGLNFRGRKELILDLLSGLDDESEVDEAEIVTRVEPMPEC